MADRTDYLDIAKGIGILMVVLGHMIDTQGVDMWEVHHFIYSFHVPLFFFISGIFHKDGQPIGQYIRKKVRDLYIPYIGISFILICIESLNRPSAGLLSMRTLIDLAIGSHISDSIAGPLWFLSVLFRCSVSYMLLSSLFNNSKIAKTVICIASFICGIFISRRCMLSQSFIALFFYSLGNLLLSERMGRTRSLSVKAISACLVLSLTLVIFVSRINITNFAYGQYGNAFLFLTGALSGILMVLCISILLDNKVALLSRIGRNTKGILCFHLLIIRMALKAFSLLSESCDVTYNISGIAMPAAFILSVTIPCIASELMRHHSHSQKSAI